MRIHPIPALLCLAVAALGVLPATASPTPSQALKADAKVAKPAAKAPGPAPAKADAPLLPTSFSGWEAGSAAKPATDPAQIDATSAAALKEYGFTDGLVGDYTRGGETLHVKALRFVDASGAFGAYSYYRHSGWPKEDIGTGATSDHNRVLFWKGNLVIDSSFSRISAMSGSELRELASTLPVPSGNKSMPPPILFNLPQKDLDGQTTHYALGEAGYVGSDPAKDAVGVLPPQLVGFDRGAESATATYKLRSGPAVLTVINYPTPQMAAAQEKAIVAYLKAGNSPQRPWTKALQDSNPAAIEARRSGPLVVVVSGDAITDEAHKLLTSVHYEADTASLPGPGSNDVQKTAQLLLGIVTLVVVMFVAALILALFLGGGRAAYRYARGKPLSSVHDEEFIRLDLN
jgi:hypothetical protein